MHNIFINFSVILILACLSIIDIKKQIVPPLIIAALIPAGFILMISPESDIVFHFKGLAIIFLITFIFSATTYGLGGGDVKLFAALGFIYGASDIIEVMIISFILSGIFIVLMKGIYLIIPRFSCLNIKNEIAFVPFISISFCLILSKNLLYYL